MSGTFPSSPTASGVTLRSLTPTLMSTAQSLKRQVRTRGGQRWGALLNWAPMLRASATPLEAFCVAQDGQFGAFQIVLPPPYDAPQGSWAGGAPLVNGAGQVGSSISLKGFTINQSAVVKAGDLLKFTDSKVYMATADANSDAGGLATVALKPKLIVSPANNEAVVYTSVPFTMMLGGDLLEFPWQPPTLFTYQLSLMEAY